MNNSNRKGITAHFITNISLYYMYIHINILFLWFHMQTICGYKLTARKPLLIIVHLKLIQLADLVEWGGIYILKTEENVASRFWPQILTFPLAFYCLQNVTSWNLTLYCHRTTVKNTISK